MPPVFDFRAVDLFSGAGGFHKGLEGIAKVVLASEIDRAARATYAANFPGTPLAGDVRELTEFPPYDLLCAGFPCQPFSLAGNDLTGKPRGLLDPRGTLFYEIVRILKATRPAGFILENVPAIQNHDKGRTFPTILRELEGAGYAVDWRVINAAPWVPQNRKRIFFMGVRSEGNGLDTLFQLKALKIKVPPKPWPVLADVLHEFVDPECAPGPMSPALLATLRDRDRDNEKAGRGYRSVVSGPDEAAHTLTTRYASANRCSEVLVRIQDREFDLTDRQKKSVRTAFSKAGRRCPIVRDPNLPSPAFMPRNPARAGRNAILVGTKLMPDRSFDRTEDEIQRVIRCRESSDRTDPLDILSDLEKPARTLIGQDPGKPARTNILVGDGERIRRITPREAARIMGFPEEFLLPESEPQGYKQMGNAVVPQVVRAVAEAMLPLLASVGAAQK